MKRGFHLAVLSVLTLGLALSGVACKSRKQPPGEVKRARIQELYDTYRESFPDTASLTVEDFLQRRHAESFVLVDVRTPEEQAVSMIPGAITVDDFEKTAATLRSATVVAYCTIGARSGAYARELQERGIPAMNLEGSLLAWTHAGQMLVTSTGETRQVHTYGPEWDLAAEGYETTW